MIPFGGADMNRPGYDRWLALEQHVAERPHQGYRNRGRRPIEIVELYLKSVAEAA